MVSFCSTSPNLKMEGLEQLIQSTSTLSSAWSAKTESFMKRIEKKWQKNIHQMQNSEYSDEIDQDDLSEEHEYGHERNTDNEVTHEYDFSSNRSSPMNKTNNSKSKSNRKKRSASSNRKDGVDTIDADDLFVSPASLVFKKTVLNEVEILLTALDNKVYVCYNDINIMYLILYIMKFYYCYYYMFKYHLIYINVCRFVQKLNRNIKLILQIIFDI